MSRRNAFTGDPINCDFIQQKRPPGGDGKISHERGSFAGNDLPGHRTMTTDIMASPALAEFMQSPLVTWVRTFEDEDTKHFAYDQLRDGLLLYNLWLQIDPHPPYRGVSQPMDDSGIRVRNLDILLHNIKAFYEDVLGQLLVMRVPDVLLLGRTADDEVSISEMQTLLLLILGSAVQCERKQYFIEHIKTLDVDVQHTIMECIQTLADNPEAVWSAEWSDLQLLPSDDHEHMYSLCVQHVRRLCKERDELVDRLVNMISDQENGTRDSPPGPEKPHLIVELADVKSRLRKLQQELEEKNESITEVKEELEESKETVNRLRQENLELVQEARTAIAYRDEIDILTERVRKMDRLENEIQKYREKLNELDFYKSRVEELREDNKILVETKTMLEEQLEGNGKKSDQIVELEAEVRKHSSRLKDMMLQKDMDQRKIQQLLEENAKLQVDRKTAMEELVRLQAELCQAKSEYTPSEENSLLLQLNTDAQTRALQLELENRRLRMLVEENTKEAANALQAVEDKQQLLPDMEAHKKELEKLLEEMRQNMKVDQAHCEQMERTVNILTTENQKLQRVVETNQEKLEEIQEELHGLETENKKLNKTLDTLKHSIPKLHDLEREAMELKSEKNALEHEKKYLDRENNKLKQLLETRETTIDEYLSKLSLLEQENRQLQKDAEHAGQLANQLQEYERENKELLQQMSVDKKTLHSLRQELVNEKMKCQQLQGDLERINLALKTKKQQIQPAVKEEEQLQSKIESDLVPEERDLGLLNNSDATSHILHLKSVVADLEEQNRSISHQNVVLKKQNTECRTQIETLERSLAATIKRREELHASHAKMEVELSLLNSRYSSVASQNSTLQSQLISMESECNHLKTSQLELQEANDSLIADQKALQTLHEQLANDYDCLVANYTTIKTAYKSLRGDHINLKEQTKSLRETHEQLLADHQTVTEAQKAIQMENIEIKCKCNELQGEIAAREVETSKLSTCCEVLTDKNATLEEEQRNVLAQVSFLLVQYHELLSQVLKQQGWFHKEDSHLKEKLRDLWQQKERLEQMIQDHCNRRLDTSRRKQSRKTPKRQDDDSESSSSTTRPARRKGTSRSSLEDLSQDDHIPVRDVGPASPLKQSPHEETPQTPTRSQTTVENHMTINLTTNLKRPNDVSRITASRPTPGRHRSSLIVDSESVEVMKSPTERPQSTPPAGEGGKENSIWYEYGCV